MARDYAALLARADDYIRQDAAGADLVLDLRDALAQVLTVQNLLPADDVGAGVPADRRPSCRCGVARMFGAEQPIQVRNPDCPVHGGRAIAAHPTENGECERPPSPARLPGGAA